MRVKQVVSRLPVGLGFLAISGALFFRGTQVYGALWAGLAPLSAIFLALALPWMVSAVRSWNAWNLHNVVLLSLIFLPGGSWWPGRWRPARSTPPISAPMR